MTTVLIVILVLVLLGGGLGYQRGWLNGPGIGILGVILVVILLVWLLQGGRI